MAGTEKKWRDWETHPTVLSHRAWPDAFSLDMVPLCLRCNSSLSCHGLSKGFPVNSSRLCLDLGRAYFRLPELGDQDGVLSLFFLVHCPF